MEGPDILARSLTRAKIRDHYDNTWQYHSQSDNHSKLACWTLLFDLLQNCPLLVKHVAEAKVGFGINHEMFDFRTGRKKNLDLVLCTPGTATYQKVTTFASQAGQYGVRLTPEESGKLAGFPELERVSVGSVHVAIEAKACMTEHIKALPRLYDELNSSHSAIHGSADFTIAAGLALVNNAATFISPGLNKYDLKVTPPKLTLHNQPAATLRTISKLREIPRRTVQNEQGFDALGIVVIDMKNDGSKVSIITDPPAPPPQDWFNYDQMVRRIASLYAAKFGYA